jgi:YfiR/HmsC-like
VWTGRPVAAIDDTLASSSAVRAGLLYNLAKFADWPADALTPGTPLWTCTNDTGVADALQSLKGREVNGHPLEVRRISVDSVDLRGCQMLYICNIDAAQSLQIIDDLRDTTVLTVSDFGRFAALGGVVQFLVEGGRIRFAINIDAMRRQRVQLSSRLLALASIVKDDPGRARQGRPEPR